MQFTEIFIFSTYILFTFSVTVFFCFSLVFSDNVHFQQAAQISKALVDEQVDFDAMVRKQQNCILFMQSYSNEL